MQLINIKAIDKNLARNTEPFKLNEEIFRSISNFILAVRLQEGHTEREILARMRLKDKRSKEFASVSEALKKAEQDHPGVVFWGGKCYDEKDLKILISIIANLTNNTLSELPKTVNVISSNHHTNLCSNFAPLEIEINTGWCGYQYCPNMKFKTVEAFIQYLKLPFSSELKEEIANFSGRKAKTVGSEINRILLAFNKPPLIYFAGQEIPFNSKEHKDLIFQAIKDKFRIHTAAQDQLLKTFGKTITHITKGAPSDFTSLTTDEFVELLDSIRLELVKKRFPALLDEKENVKFTIDKLN